MSEAFANFFRELLGHIKALYTTPIAEMNMIQVLLAIGIVAAFIMLMRSGSERN